MTQKWQGLVVGSEVMGWEGLWLGAEAPGKEGPQSGALIQLRVGVARTAASQVFGEPPVLAAGKGGPRRE